MNKQSEINESPLTDSRIPYFALKFQDIPENNQQMSLAKTYLRMLIQLHCNVSTHPFITRSHKLFVKFKAEQLHPKYWELKINHNVPHSH